jgi:dihydropteroate synthase
MSQAANLSCGRFTLSLARPLVMGILNVTPDSFSDGGHFLSPQAAINRAHQMIAEGADIIDLGAESTRPGAEVLTEQEELARLLPVLDGLRDITVPISVDTRRAAVMTAVLERGADMINDVDGFRDPASIRAVANSSAALCIMHMQGEPSTMQQAPVYRDVVSEVSEFLYRQADALLSSGVSRSRIVLDPGIGFGKTRDQNLDLLHGVLTIANQQWPILIGLSRKSLIGELTGRKVADRLAGSLGGMIAAALNGANILRVHDVAQTRDCLKVAYAVLNR